MNYSFKAQLHIIILHQQALNLFYSRALRPMQPEQKNTDGRTAWKYCVLQETHFLDRASKHARFQELGLYCAQHTQ